MKKIIIIIISSLIAVLLPTAAVHAEEQENVILKAQGNKVDIGLNFPGVSEGITTLSLSFQIKGNMDKLDQSSPFSFEPDKGISYKLLDTRFRQKDGRYTIYISDLSRITDKSFFRLGSLEPNSVDNETYDLNISVPEDGVKFIESTGKFEENMKASSSVLQLQVNQKEETETPGDSTEETPGGSTEETPGDTTEETPGDTTEETPGDTTEETPGGSTEETPGDTTEETPGDTTEETPGDTTEETPGGSTEENTDNSEEDTSGNPAKEETETQENSGDTEKTQEAVQTGDQRNVAVYLTLLAMSIAGIVLVKKKKKDQRQ